MISLGLFLKLIVEIISMGSHYICVLLIKLIFVRSKAFILMKYKLFLYFLLCITLFGIGCTSKTIGTKSEEDYSEDLSRYRINYKDSLEALGVGSNEDRNVVPNPEQTNISGNIAALETEFAITDSIDNFLNEVTALNRETNSYQGVTIQVYSGLNREKANEAKNKVYDALPSAEPRLVYEQPNYKVKVGKYADRLQAQKDYAILKDAFPLVLIVPERFKVVE